MFNDRQKAFARKHWRWLMPVMIAAVVWGLYAQNIFSVIGGVSGVVWIAVSLTERRG